MSRRRVRATKMASLIDQWRRADTSASSFAREHGVSKSTLYRWRRRLSAQLARERAGAAPRPPAFVPVDVAPPSSAAVIEVVLRSGERVQIGTDASPALVQTVLTTLRAAC